MAEQETRAGRVAAFIYTGISLLRTAAHEKKVGAPVA